MARLLVRWLPRDAAPRSPNVDAGCACKERQYKDVLEDRDFIDWLQTGVRGCFQANANTMLCST